MVSNSHGQSEAAPHHDPAQHWHKQEGAKHTAQGGISRLTLRLVTVQSVWSIRLRKSKSSNLNLVYADLYYARTNRAQSLRDIVTEDDGHY